MKNYSQSQSNESCQTQYYLTTICLSLFRSHIFMQTSFSHVPCHSLFIFHNFQLIFRLNVIFFRDLARKSFLLSRLKEFISKHNQQGIHHDHFPANLGKNVARAISKCYFPPPKSKSQTSPQYCCRS